MDKVWSFQPALWPSSAEEEVSELMKKRYFGVWGRFCSGILAEIRAMDKSRIKFGSDKALTESRRLPEEVEKDGKQIVRWKDWEEEYNGSLQGCILKMKDVDDRF